MATTFNVAEITADVATLTNSPPFSATTRITSTEVTYWLAQAVRSLSALLRQHHINDHELLQTAALATVNGVNVVSLPSNCGEVHAVLWARGANDYVLVRKALQDDLAERSAGGWTAIEPVYRLEGETLAFYPTPTAVHALQLFYTHHVATPLGATIQMRVDCDRWLALDVACRVQTAKNKPDANLQQQKALLENDLLNPDRGRDPNAVETIRDTRAQSALSYFRRRWG